MVHVHLEVKMKNSKLEATACYSNCLLLTNKVYLYLFSAVILFLVYQIICFRDNYTCFPLTAMDNCTTGRENSSYVFNA